MIQALIPSARIERISNLTLHDLVGIGVHDARRAQDASGRRWVTKSEENTGMQPLLSEAIGFLLGRELGVPVPDAAVCLEPTTRAWLSLCIDDVTHWRPDIADNLTNAADLGAMVALDAIIMNGDRHPGNLLIQPDPDVAHLRVWAIDAGNARVGYASDFARDAEHGDLPQLHPYVQGLPFNLMEEPGHIAAHAASKLRDGLIVELVRECCEIARCDDAALLAQALTARCRNAPTLFDQMLRQLKARG